MECFNESRINGYVNGFKLKNGTYGEMLQFKVRYEKDYKDKNGQTKTTSTNIKVVAFGDLAMANRDLQDGDFVKVVGELKNNAWTNPRTNEKVWETQIKALNIEPVRSINSVVPDYHQRDKSVSNTADGVPDFGNDDFNL